MILDMELPGLGGPGVIPLTAMAIIGTPLGPFPEEGYAPRPFPDGEIFPPPDNALLLEVGDYLLQETGEYILLEDESG